MARGPEYDDQDDETEHHEHVERKNDPLECDDGRLLAQGGGRDDDTGMYQFDSEFIIKYDVTIAVIDNHNRIDTSQ